MSCNLQTIRGTKDLFNEQYKVFKYITDTSYKISALYGFLPIETPIIESSEVFSKTLGDSSDIVQKEIYSFQDKGGDFITLRPEFTAAIARAFINELQHHPLPLKLFSSGPLFRYERPQRGRYRQFNQINFEILGSEAALADIEIISLAFHILKALQIKCSYTLEINSLGDKNTRLLYKKALVEFLSKYKSDLSNESKNRLESNPLRVLDSKANQDKEIIKNAPLIQNFYTPEAQIFWELILTKLEQLSIPYSLNPYLVRGLDYYSDTVFEITSPALGAQNALISGGRYNNLIEMMGGPRMGGVGCAGGIERLVELINYTLPLSKEVSVIPIGEKAEASALQLVHQLRLANIKVQYMYSGNLQKRLRKAQHSLFAILIGEKELATQQIIVKNLKTGKEEAILITEAINFMQLNLQREGCDYA